MLNVIFFTICYRTITNFPQYGKMWYMDLLIFYSRFSLISLSSFSFSNSVFTASISTLPYSFFFPLPFWSILFPFVNMSHHRFPLYHHWSPSPVFFFPLLFALSSLFYLRVTYRRGSLGCGFGLWLFVLSWAADSLFVVLRVADSPFYLWRFHRFVLHLLRTGKFSVFFVILWDCHIVI